MPVVFVPPGATTVIGPVTALAKVQCSIGANHFTDLLTLIFVDGRWQVIAKVFHVDISTRRPANP